MSWNWLHQKEENELKIQVGDGDAETHEFKNNWWVRSVNLRSHSWWKKESLSLTDFVESKIFGEDTSDARDLFEVSAKNKKKRLNKLISKNWRDKI